MRQKRRSAAEWAEICREYRSSGQAAEEYARRRGLKASTLLWWTSRLRQELDAAEASQRSFVEVVTPAPAATPARAVVRVGDVAVEFVDTLPPAQWVAELASLGWNYEHHLQVMAGG